MKVFGKRFYKRNHRYRHRRRLGVWRLLIDLLSRRRELRAVQHEFDAISWRARDFVCVGAKLTAGNATTSVLDIQIERGVRIFVTS